MEKKFSIHSAKAKDFMSENVITVSPKDELSKVLGKMKRYDIQEVPVVDKGRILGLINYHSIIKRRKLPISASAENVMVSPPKIAPSDSLIKTAEILLTSGFRAAPVTTYNKLVGIISRSDLVRAAKHLGKLGDIPVSSIMSHSPVQISEKEGVIKAKDMMRDMGIRTLPVIDSKKRLVGVLRLKDLTRFLETPRDRMSFGATGGQKIPLDISVRSVMSPPVTVGSDANVRDAIDKMIKYRTSSVIVVEEQRPIGIVKEVDILELIAGYKEKEMYYVQISGLEGEAELFESIYDIVQKGMKRVSRFVKPNVLSLRINQYHQRGRASKYSVQARLSTERGLYITNAHDWDLFSALDHILERFEAQIKKDKEKERERRKLASRVSRREF